MNASLTPDLNWALIKTRMFRKHQHKCLLLIPFMWNLGIASLQYSVPFTYIYWKYIFFVDSILITTMYVKLPVSSNRWLFW